MRKSKFTESQIMAALKQFQAGLPVNDLCRQVGAGSATFGKNYDVSGKRVSQKSSEAHIPKEDFKFIPRDKLK